MGFARRESYKQCPQQPLSLQTVFDDYSFFFMIFFSPRIQACSRQTYHSILYLLHIFFIITLFIFVVRTYECGVAVNTVILNPNQVELISGDANGCIKIWDLETNSCKGEIFQSEVSFIYFFIIFILFYYPHSQHTVFFNISRLLLAVLSFCCPSAVRRGTRSLCDPWPWLGTRPSSWLALTRAVSSSLPWIKIRRR
jgi:hypothetical protein